MEIVSGVITDASNGLKYDSPVLIDSAPDDSPIEDCHFYHHMDCPASGAAKAFYGDLYNLPEGLGHFDVAVVGMILPHLRDPFLALQNVCRLRPYTIIVTQQCPRGDQPHALFMPDPNVDPVPAESYFACC